MKNLITLQTIKNDRIDVTDLHKIISSTSMTSSKSTPSRVADSMISSTSTLKEDLALLDKKKIEATLERTNGNVSKAAVILAISRETLHNKIRRYGVNVQLYRIKKTKKK